MASLMEFLLSSPINALGTLFAFFLFLHALLRLSSSRRDGSKKQRAAPEAGGAWPVIGHLHLLGGPEPPHIVLGNMAEKYGPIFTIRMGVHRTLVVSNWEMAKECLTTNDKSFANRPKTLAAEIMGYDRAMFGFADYGPYWREIRKIATLELLSARRLELLKRFRETEVRIAMKEMYKVWEKNSVIADKASVDMRKWFGDLTLNVIFSMIVGKSLGYSSTGEGDKWRNAVRGFFNYTGRFVLSDAVPLLRFWDIGRDEKEMKKIAKEFDQAIEGLLDEHKQKKSACSGDQVIKGGDNFMGLMLTVVNDETVALSGRDADTINKSTCIAMILGGSDTTSVTLTWALSLLVNHPEVLKRVQNELDMHVGKERQVQESDIQNLAYLQAVIKETMRLYPASPLSVPHESFEDCTVDGYHIPARTRLLVNIRKIHRDPRVWADPDAFQPERFLTTHKDFDYRGQNFEYMPFGSGRRICPGISFALHVTRLTLATLLQSFDFSTQSGEPVDMTESIGITNLKKTPLELLLSPRLPKHLYE